MREIKGSIYRITDQNMDVKFVECKSFEELCRYLASTLQYRIGRIEVYTIHPYYGLQFVDIYHSAEYKKATERFVVKGYQKATHIQWDTDGCRLNLPREVEIPEGIVDEDEIGDYLSDLTGFCHAGFDIEFVTTEVVEIPGK